MKSYSADFCTRRIYSETPDLFEYNLVYKYTCLKQRLGEKQYITHEITENFFEKCMVEGHPKLVVQGCLAKQEKKEQYVTPFNEAHKLKNRKVKETIKGKTYDYDLHYEMDNDYIPYQFEEEKINDFVCKNAKAKIKMESILPLPVHLTTAMGQQYIRKFNGDIGFYSINLDEKAPYYDASATDRSWTVKGGAAPEQIPFKDWKYDAEKRNFQGMVDYEGDYFGAYYAFINITFDAKFLEVEAGYRQDLDQNKKPIAPPISYFVGALKAYEMIIIHKIKPIDFEFDCKAIK